jgi:hypothetical protein
MVGGFLLSPGDMRRGTGVLPSQLRTHIIHLFDLFPPLLSELMVTCRVSVCMLFLYFVWCLNV